VRKKPKRTGLGPELRRRRERKGLSLTGLAERIDVSPSTLRRIEAGEIADLRVAMLIALARELDFGLDDIAADAGLLDKGRQLAPRGLDERDLDGVAGIADQLAAAISELRKRSAERSRPPRTPRER
jgi:transcriptional regulator with XRE-family HTH domain